MRQLNIFKVHGKEKTAEGTEQVQTLAGKFSNDCKKLMQFWQSKWYWLSNEDGRTFGISSYLSARVYDLREQGIEIESIKEGHITRFRLKCTCKIVGGNDIVNGCYLHDPAMKIT